jgi:hypothetical protein
MTTTSPVSAAALPVEMAIFPDNPSLDTAFALRTWISPEVVPAPLCIETVPPRFALDAPAEIATLPESPDWLSPTEIATDPLLDTDAPVCSKRLPLARRSVVPVCTVTDPLSDMSSPLAEAIITCPDVPSLEAPLIADILPPAPRSDAPGSNTIPPAAPVLAAPVLREIPADDFDAEPELMAM